jgi:protein-disulfide isomerase
MLEHIPEIAARLGKQLRANHPLTAEQKTALAQSGSAVRFGPTDAKVQVVAFVDFESRGGTGANKVIHQIVEKYGNRVRLIFRQFPQPANPNARAAAEAVLAANAQGKFWELHDPLFSSQNDRAGLQALARHAGLNLTAFNESLDHHAFGAVIDADVKLGEQASVDAPALFINGIRTIPTSFEAAVSAIDAALNEQALSMMSRD